MMYKEDSRCESLISTNRSSFEIIKNIILKDDLMTWTDLLTGVRPIQAKKETLEAWLSLYRERMPKLLELDNRIQSLILRAKVPRVFVICTLRKLQREYGLSTNFNAFKDSAIRKLVELNKHG